MSKKKRIRRDLDKYYRVGRYWDLLRLLEDEGLVSEHAREHKEAWKAVIKQALKQERAFTRFCREVGALKVLPECPRLSLPDAPQGFYRGPEHRRRSPGAEGIDSRMPKSSGPTSPPSLLRPCTREKLTSLLEKFVREPDKITRRYFEQVAELVPMTLLGVNVSRLGESISLARRFNQKAAVARGWDGVDLRRLKLLDGRLLRVSQSLSGGSRGNPPQPLRA